MPRSASRAARYWALVSTIWPSSSSVPMERISARTHNSLRIAPGTGLAIVTGEQQRNPNPSLPHHETPPKGGVLWVLGSGGLGYDARVLDRRGGESWRMA